jgi:hypothetical protein
MFSNKETNIKIDWEQKIINGVADEKIYTISKDKDTPPYSFTRRIYLSVKEIKELRDKLNKLEL